MPVLTDSWMISDNLEFFVGSSAGGKSIFCYAVATSAADRLLPITQVVLLFSPIDGGLVVIKPGYSR
jgi:hypothetical protein